MPANTPPDIVARLHKETIAALETPELREKYAKSGMTVVYDKDPAELRKRLEQEIANRARVIREAKLKFE